MNYRKIQNSKRPRVVLSLFSACLLGNCTGSVFHETAYAAETEAAYGTYYAICPVNVRTGPGEDYEILGELAEGDVFSVYELAGDWARICFQDSTECWVNIGYIAGTDADYVENSSDAESSDMADVSWDTEESDPVWTTPGLYAAMEEGTSLYQDPVEVPDADAASDESDYSDESDSLNESDSSDISDYSGNSDFSDDTCMEENTEESEETSGEYPGEFLEGKQKVLTIYPGDYIYVSEVQGLWGRVSWNQQDVWVRMDSLNYISDCFSSGNSEGWEQDEDGWNYYDNNGTMVYSSDVLYEEWYSIQGCYSATDFYIVVDCENNALAVFQSSDNGWIPYIYWSCSTGRAGHETIKGNFSLLDKGYSFGEPKYSCYYYTEFSPKYLFHSVLYEAGTFDIQDGTLGQSVSNGCVRLAIENAKWICDNIPLGTPVYIY